MDTIHQSNELDALLRDKNYQKISFEDSIALDGYRHAAHCVIYASTDYHKVFGEYPTLAAVMMQMRFDGAVGFPGGLIDEGVDIIRGLNRELREEINLDTNSFSVLQENHIISHTLNSTKLCLHLYGLKVSLEDFKSIERGAHDAREYGNETMGIFRVPLFTIEEKECFRGFPAFLQNNLIGNARDQLLFALAYLNIMSVETLLTVLQRSQQ